MWTHFWDMHSGGGQKLAWAHIFIEAPKEEAERVFYHRFDRNPNQVTCTCCGPDYAISEEKTLEQATAYHRGCRATNETRYTLSDAKIDLPTFCTREDILVIRAEEILPHEREGDLPQKGYVWVD